MRWKIRRIGRGRKIKKQTKDTAQFITMLAIHKDQINTHKLNMVDKLEKLWKNAKEED